MLALHKGSFRQTALLPQRACSGLRAVRQWPPALPVSSSSSRGAAATHILRSSTNGDSSSSSSSSDDSAKPPSPQHDQEDAQPTGTGSTTPYPAPDALQRKPPSSTTGSNKPEVGPASSSRGSSRKNSSSSGGPEPPELEGGPRNNLPPQLQRLLLLLTEFGGIYGTAAVAIAWFTHVDPFGNLHWSSADVLLGLATFAPLLALDALLMLPDYAIGPEDSQEVAGMFFGDPEALRNMSASNISVVASSDSDTSDDSSSSSAKPAAAVSSSAEASGSSVNPTLRLRVALELLQQVYTRANPGIGLSPVAELGVVAVSVLADEMLYRAVGLKLLGLWVRDRLYEAGVDENISLSGLGRSLELPTAEFARYAAVALVAVLGMAGFAAGALREKESLKRLQVLDKDGEPSEKADALKAQLVASMSSQNIVMYGVEGVREVTASIMAGVSFVATGNLAAPLAGSFAAQTLFSAYQRYSLARSKNKRKELLGKMKQRSQKLQAAMQAAITAKKAAPDTTAADVAESTAAAEDLVADGGSSGLSEAGAVGVNADSSSSNSSNGEGKKQEEVDFLTLVLQAAEQQQEQEKQQQRQQQQQQAKQAAAAAISSSNGDGAAAGTSIADWAASAVDSSSSEAAAVSSSSNSSSGDGSVAAAEAAKQQLGVLLEDMLRSPEGFKVVQRWLKSQNTTSSSSSSNASNGTSSSSTDPRQAVEQLLADPAVKARLLAELQEQLCAVSEAQTQRQKQQDTWRR